MVGLYVRDFDAALRFYREVLGIPLGVDSHGDYHHADYSFHEPYFHFAIFPISTGRPAGDVHLSFSVEDCLDAFSRAVAAGAPVRREPGRVSYSGGGWSAEVLDPDGNEVEFFQLAAE
jgi:predicted enzyme related to lactoylglutathione lyase